MRNANSRTLETSLRLDAIVNHLGIAKHWEDNGHMEVDVISACRDKVSSLLTKIEPKGEILAQVIATHFQVQFEEVRTNFDIDKLEEVYLYGKKELGFAQVREEIASPSVDALLFQRINATSSDRDRWVAILNLTITEDRAYWNKFHELAHRLAEPPQPVLPFKRQKVNDRDEVERLIDLVAGSIAFHPSLFSPHVSPLQKMPLSFEIVEMVRQAYAPTASLLSVTNAIVSAWPRPALAFVASMQPKRSGDGTRLDLRVQPQSRNKLAVEANLILRPNMRVPINSAVYETFRTGISSLVTESTNIWTFSTGGSIPIHPITLAGISLGERVYGIMSLS